MHSEAKQTETLEFGAEKGLSLGHARRTRMGAHAQKTLKLLQGFQQSIFIGQVREGRRRVGDQLVPNSLIG